MTIIVPGVLAGSKGALYYPPDECRNSVPEWDAVPITLYHPTDAAGFPVSASHPNAKQIGHLRNTTFDGKLRTEGWFDVEKTRAADAEAGTNVLFNLEHGHPTELSTGLYTENVPSKGVHKGRLYEYVARNYRADHLAVLVGQQGACSLNDGCGVLVNAEKPANCTCNYPKTVLRNGSGHAPDCLCHQEWKAKGGFKQTTNKKKGCGDGG